MRDRMRDKEPGLTLIEVVAAITLLATTVTALLAVQSRSLAQLHAAHQREKAASLATDLVARCRCGALEPTGEGIFANDPGWSWTRSALPYTDATTTDLMQVTLTVSHTDVHGAATEVIRYVWLERAKGEHDVARTQ